MAKDGSRYEHGVGDTQRGGYDVSDHHDKNINPHNELPHESNGLTTSGRDTADRLLENQNAHRRYRNSTALPEATPQGGQTPSQEHMGNQSSDNVYIKRESPDLHSNDLSNRGESTNMATRAERDTQGAGPRHWRSDEDGKLIGYIQEGLDWTQIATRMHRSEGSVRGHWYYGNLRRDDPRAQGVSYMPLLGRGPAGPRQ